MSSNDNLDLQFAEMKTAREEVLMEPGLYESTGDLYDAECSEDEFDSALGFCKAAATGPDEIHHEMMRKLPRSTRLILLKAFNEIWTNDLIPDSWTQALVIPILKPGKCPLEPKGYRSKSFTSCMCE